MNAEITLDSGEVSYDPSTELIMASGGVVVVQTLDNGKKRELHSEAIEYKRSSGEINLIGESIVQEPGGEVISAKNVKLSREFQDAIADALIVVLNDSSKIKAGHGTKSNNVFSFDNASYSPCKETSCSAPLWDIVADKVIYDRDHKTIVYKNVKLRLKGVPILWTPYLSHPGPEVKRKAGVLTPIMRDLSDVGFLFGVPFYAPIKEDRDLKITPFVISKKRALVSSEYRQLFSRADFDISASFLTRDHKRGNFSKTEGNRSDRRSKNCRWHVDSVFKTHNLDNKSLAVRFNRSSDLTYKSVYPVDSMHERDLYIRPNYNDSNVALAFHDDQYFLSFDSHLYQTEDREDSPLVFPHINFNGKSGNFSIDSDTVCLRRGNTVSPFSSENFFRSSNTINWTRSFDISPAFLEVKSGFRSDLFSVSGTRNSKEYSHKNFFPVLENLVSLSFPFVSKLSFDKTQSVIWGPKLSFISTEASKKRANFTQNEDSIFDNYSDLSFYAFNRFSGYDYIENGERVAAGFEGSFYNAKRRWMNAFLGASRNVGNRQLEKIKGKDSAVGRFVLKPSENLSFRMRFVGVPVIEKSRLFEAGISGNVRNLYAGVGYFFDKRLARYVQGDGTSQLGVNCGFNLNEFWKISASKILNLRSKNGKRNLSQGVWANYTDECLDFKLGVFRTNFRNNDIKPRTGIILSMALKNLGNFVKSDMKRLHDSLVGSVE